jgi:hypothetical protein
MRIDWDGDYDGRWSVLRVTYFVRRGWALSDNSELRPYAKGLQFEDGYLSASVWSSSI